MLNCVRRVYRNTKRVARWSLDLPRFGWKGARELLYWQGRYYQGGMKLAENRDNYRRTMLAMAGEQSPLFLNDKIVADFGCGPRGSLCWAEMARERIGIDLLVDGYARFGISRHNIHYVRSTEAAIPLPSDHVDFLFTLNAMDHVNDFGGMMAECARILAPGGQLIASFNLDEPPTISEPQTLTEELVAGCLLSHFQVLSCRIGPRGPVGNPYVHLFHDEIPADIQGPRIMWVRAKKL